jgi:hypothetical protein
MLYSLCYYSIVFTDGANLEWEISFLSPFQEDIRSYVIVLRVMAFSPFSPGRMVTVAVIVTKDTAALNLGPRKE